MCKNFFDSLKDAGIQKVGTGNASHRPPATSDEGDTVSRTRHSGGYYAFKEAKLF